MTTKLGTIIADFKTALATKLSAGGNSCSLQSITDDDGVTIPNGTYFFTIDGDNAQKEHIVATLTGVNLTAIKSVSRQGVQTANAVREHRIGASVSITNFAHIKYLNDLMDGTTDWNASVPIKYDAQPVLTLDDELATVKYVNDTAIAGGAHASTTTEGISFLTVDPVDPVIPIAIGDNDGRIPTTDEKDALAGTSGTPSNTNKFVTADDVDSAKTANKIARRDANGDVLVATTPSTADSAASKDYVDTALALKPNLTQVVGVDTGATYYNYVIPFCGDAAATVVGWGKGTAGSIKAVASGYGLGGLTQVDVSTTATDYIYTGFGFAKTAGTGRNFKIKFVGLFTDGANANTFAFSIGGAIGAVNNTLSLMYNHSTQKMEFYTKAAGSSTVTDLSANVSPGTIYLFEIEYNYNASVILKVNGTTRATHDTVANIPAITTVSNIFVGRSTGTTSGTTIGAFSPITVSYQIV